MQIQDASVDIGDDIVGSGKPRSLTVLEIQGWDHKGSPGRRVCPSQPGRQVAGEALVERVTGVKPEELPEPRGSLGLYCALIVSQAGPLAG